MGRRKNKLTAQDVAKFMITSRESAETFIKLWMERHNESREQALARLKELGIEFSKLPDKL